MSGLLQRLARPAASQAAALGDALAAVRSELRPCSGAAAWHVQRRGAAAEAGSSEEPPAAAAAAAAAAPAPPAGEAPAAAAAAAPAPEAGAAAKPAKQPPNKQQAGKQQQPVKGKPAAPKQAGKARQQGGNSKAASSVAAEVKQALRAQFGGQQEAAGDASAAGPGNGRISAAPAGPSRVSGLSVAQLLEAPVNTYFEVPAGVLPEATKEYYEDPVLKGENVHEPNYGCRAVQQEWDFSGRRLLMARSCMQALTRTVQEKQSSAAASGGGGHLFLDGWAGSGKSVAVYSLVAWARAQGWLALYLPSAFSLVQNGTYYRGDDGLWDTPEAARWVLSSLRDSHAALLPDLKAPSGQSLSELVEEGLASSTKPAAVVAAAVAAKEAVQALKEVPTLIAVDDYNILYSHTGYYESVHNFHRRQLAPDELRLVRAFRVLEQPQPANGVAVAAPTFGQTISDKLRMPRPRQTRFALPRYTLPEVASAADYFVQQVMHGQAHADAGALRRALFLTNGNASELRKLAPGLFCEESTLGISRGYKAGAARRKAYEAGQI